MRSRLGPDADQGAAVQTVDLRLIPAACALWLGVIAGLHVHPHWLIAGGALCAIAVWMGRRLPARHGGHVGAGASDPTPGLAVLVAATSLTAGLAIGCLEAAPIRDGPVSQWASAGAFVRAQGVVTDDPSVRSGEQAGGAPYVTLRLRIDTVTGRGQTVAARTPVLVVASDLTWSTLLPGTPVAVQGQLAPASGALAAFLRVDAPPDVQGEPSLASRATEPFRAGLRLAVQDLPEVARGLVPGLAIGDDDQLPAAVRADMQATGLTHLTAVSGMHVGILLISVLALARWIGVRGYGVPAVAMVTIVAFALLVRPDPSVVRASAMGLIGVLGLTVAGRKRALPALATSVLVLLLIDPWLAISVGFALSVLSTAGIVILAAHWRDGARWAPQWLAESIAVPLAAQVASLPVLVGFVAETSLAAVPTNILAAPAVAPATLLGVAAALVSPILPGLAAALAWLASWPARWIATVAEQGAALPGAVVRWPGGAVSVATSVVLVAVIVVVMPMVLRRIVLCSGLCVAAVVVLVVVPSLGWPPRNWVLVACPVGQGDAFVVNAGDGAALVVDAGPDPLAVDQCLDELGIRTVPLLVLTHFHNDHVDGVPGVLSGRRVDEALVSPLAEPLEQAENVAAWLAAADVPVTVARAGEEREIGPWVQTRVVWPLRIIGTGESAANDASVVLDVLAHGVRILMTGDIEPAAQRALLRAEPGLRVDVLKVPHHGSRAQEQALLTGLGATVAVIGVGADNRHGHPAPEVIADLELAGMLVGRTDTDGAVAVVLTDDGALGLVRRGTTTYRRGKCQLC